MKTIKLPFKITIALLFLFLVTISSAMAQNPTYKAELRNDKQINDKTLEFDVYLLRTGTVPFTFTNMQFGINLNAGALNGGTITVSYVAGSSQLNAPQIPNGTKFTFTAAKNSINMTAMPGPGAGSATVISNTGFGTRIATVRVTNTVPFGKVRPDLTWGWSLTSTSVITKVSAYVDGLPVTITTQATHTISNLANGILNQNPAIYAVTGSGQYCEGLPGLPVGITNSETTVTYTLLKNGIAQTPTKVGTGAALSFGNQSAGTYTVLATNTITGVQSTMTGNAVIVMNPTPTVTSITSKTICDNSNTTIALTASAPSTFTWTVGAMTGTITGATAGSGSTISQVLDNTSNSTVATIEYVVTATGTAGTCPGPAKSVIVTVNPTVVITSSSTASWVSGVPNTYTITNSSPANTTISWTRASVAGITPATGSGTTSAITETLVNSTPFAQVVYYTITPTAFGCTGQSFDLAVTVNPTYLNLTSVFIEGLDAGDGTMKQAKKLNGVPQYAAGIADQITIELRDGANYNNLIYSISNVNVNTNGTVSTGIPTAYKGTYYITIKHRNSIETTSAVPVSFAGTTVTKSFASASDYYGSNVILKSGKYMIYSGDINHDGMVDLDDINATEIDINLMQTGYTATDLNGDGVVDLLDINKAETNSTSIITVVLPVAL